MHNFGETSATTLIMEEKVQRTDERENGFFRALRGDFGPNLQGEMRGMRFVRKHPISGSNLKMSSAHIKLVDGKVMLDKAPLPDDPELLSIHIKETAYFLRADMVGICKLPPYAVYSHSFPDGNPVELKHKYAIAVLVDQDYKTSEASTGRDWISNAMSFMAYSTSAFIACTLADYIRRLGYPARAHHALNYQVAVPPILLWAGLGEMCRIGDIVLNPFLGSRFKAAIVTTTSGIEVETARNSVPTKDSLSVNVSPRRWNSTMDSVSPILASQMPVMTMTAAAAAKRAYKARLDPAKGF